MLRQRLETDRLVLRRPQFRDIDRTVELLGDWAVIKMLAMPPYPFERGHAIRFIEYASQHWSLQDGWIYAVTKDDMLIGIVDISSGKQEPTLGYWLGHPYWGRGFMTEAVEAMIAEFFMATKQDTLFSGVFKDNPASLAVQCKIGFQVMGESSHLSKPRGEVVPHVDTMLTRARFEEVKE